jgi:hypothetical protein
METAMHGSSAGRILLSGAVIAALGLGGCAGYPTSGYIGSGYPVAGTWLGYGEPYGYYGPSALFPYSSFYPGFGVGIGGFPDHRHFGHDHFDHDLHHSGFAHRKGEFAHGHFPSAGFHHPDSGDHEFAHSVFSHHDFGRDRGQGSDRAAARPDRRLSPPR